MKGVWLTQLKQQIRDKYLHKNCIVINMFPTMSYDVETPPSNSIAFKLM